MPAPRYQLATFEASRQPPTEQLVEMRRIRAVITPEHAAQAYWSRFRDPVALALRELLQPNANVCVFWQSDGWRPRAPDDEADILTAMEILDQQGNYTGELTFQTRLPRRAERAMRRLAGVSRGQFEATPVSVDLPIPMLRQSQSED